MKLQSYKTNVTNITLNDPLSMVNWSRDLFIQRVTTVKVQELKWGG